MKMKVWLVAMALSFAPFIGFAQRDTLITKLDSLSKKTDSAGFQINNTDPHAYDENTQLNFNSYFRLLGSDLKQEFTKPFHMTRKDWRNFGYFAAAEVALSFLDEPIQKNASTIPDNNPELHKISTFITNFGGQYEFITLAGFGAYGYIFKKPKMQTTTLLATQAYIVGASLEGVLKFLSGRTRPIYYGPGEKPEPRFLGPFTKTARAADGSKLYSSFPSGHTTVAFAAATVFALEYSNKPWVPIIAYSAASLIGISRITENKHWATDVVAGAAVGFLAGKNVVNNYHRFAKLRNPTIKKTGSLSMNMQYQSGQIRPGMVYRFN